MTTCFESSSSAYSPVSKSSKSASASTETSPAEDSPLAGLMNPPSYMFYSIRQVQRLVASHSDELRADRTNNQYLVFLKVTNTQLTDMDKQRANIGKHIRMEHHTALAIWLLSWCHQRSTNQRTLLLPTKYRKKRCNGAFRAKTDWKVLEVPHFPAPSPPRRQIQPSDPSPAQ